MLQSKDSQADPTVCTQKYGSLRTKTWQDAEVLTQEVMAERRSIYDEHDRCELSLSNC